MVNDRLKKLILPEDDEDQITDAIPILFVEGSSKTSGTRSGRTSPKLSPKSAAVSTSTGSSATTSTEANATSSKPGQSSGHSSPTTTLEPPPLEPSGTADSSRKVSPTQDPPKLNLLGVLGVLISHMKFTLQETRTETLRWVMWLHQQLPKRVCLYVVLLS